MSIKKSALVAEFKKNFVNYPRHLANLISQIIESINDNVDLGYPYVNDVNALIADIEDRIAVRTPIRAGETKNNIIYLLFDALKLPKPEIPKLKLNLDNIYLIRGEAILKKELHSPAAFTFFLSTYPANNDIVGFVSQLGEKCKDLNSFSQLPDYASSADTLRSAFALANLFSHLHLDSNVPVVDIETRVKDNAAFAEKFRNVMKSENFQIEKMSDFLVQNFKLRNNAKQFCDWLCTEGLNEFIAKTSPRAQKLETKVAQGDSKRATSTRAATALMQHESKRQPRALPQSRDLELVKSIADSVENKQVETYLRRLNPEQKSATIPNPHLNPSSFTYGERKEKITVLAGQSLGEIVLKRDAELALKLQVEEIQEYQRKMRK